MLKIRLAKYELHIVPKEEIILPEYPGSTFRGGFGRAFKKAVCITNIPRCSDCLLNDRCVYPAIFETSPPVNSLRMPNQSEAPRPYVIEPPINGKRLYTPTDEFVVGLVLIGNAIDYLSYFIYSFSELGHKFGIGRNKGKFTLNKVYFIYMDERELIYSEESQRLKARGKEIDFESALHSVKGMNSHAVTLNFLTPTRILQDGKPLFRETLTFEAFIRSLFRRLSTLASFFCGAEWDLDYTSLLEKAKKISTDGFQNQEWRMWERYSYRQEQRVPMGGFVGEVTFTGDMGDFLPFIKLGEIVHIGKGTTYGLGKYEIKAVS